MAAPYNPPVKNEDFIFYMFLESMASPGSFQSNPTIAAGDFQISKDGGAYANLSTLPDVEPNSSHSVRVQLSSTEMNADVVIIRAIDQTATKEWADAGVVILTTQ